MSDLFLLTPSPFARIRPYFPLVRGIPRVDDRRVVSGVIYVLKHGLQRNPTVSAALRAEAEHRKS